MKAYRIANWCIKYEVLKNKNPAGKTVKTKMAALMKNPLKFVRFEVPDHILTADYRRLIDRAGPDLAAACEGLYKMLVVLAGSQEKKYRGWVLDDRQRPLNDPEKLAKLLCLSETKVAEILEILLDPEVKWVEFLDLPKAIRKSLNSSKLDENPQVGNKREKKGSPLIETETEKGKDTAGKFRPTTENAEENRAAGFRYWHFGNRRAR